ncbi:MAG: hypothetical protein K9H26_03670 [Prolixibacteraceae bacterium]|nr:hypothetical protein [Prolixibacteraceae bacterium]
MKKSRFFVLLASILIFVSCEDFLNFLKDPDNSGSESEIRIKTIESYYTDTITISARQEFIYSGDQIDTVILLTKDLFPDRLAEINRKIFHYNGNTITENTVINGDTTAKTVFELDGENLIKSTETHKDTEGQWQTETIIEYTYEGDKLKSQLQYDFDNGTKTKTSEDFYFYDGDLMIKCDEYGENWDSGTSEWKKVNENEYLYTNNKIDTILVKSLQADGSYNVQFKTTFEYSGDKMIKTSFIAWDYTISDWGPNLEVTYHYDDGGTLLYQYRKTMMNGTITKTAYEWENQSGNIGLLWTFPYQRQIGTSLLKSKKIEELSTGKPIAQNRFFLP